MCIIIYKPAGIAIPAWLDDDGMAMMETMNADGMGIMWPDRDTVGTLKSVEKFEDWWKLAKPVWQRSDIPVAIHFRLATHGVISEEQSHPVLLRGGKVAVMHNGVLDGYSAPSTKSDTWLFAHEMLGKLEGAWWRNRSVTSLVERSIGSGNKLVVMSRRGDVTIYNPKLGTWKDGLWFSNSGFHAACSPSVTYPLFRGRRGGKRRRGGSYRWDSVSEKVVPIGPTDYDPDWEYGSSYTGSAWRSAQAFTDADYEDERESDGVTPAPKRGEPTRYLMGSGAVVCPPCHETLRRDTKMIPGTPLTGTEELAASAAIICDWCSRELADAPEDATASN